VAFVSEDQVILGPLGPERYDPIPLQRDFMAFLESWGGTWMWESIKIVGTWDDIVREIASGEAVWVGDGSYNRKIAPEVSGGGWIIYCPSSKASVRGNFYETSEDAGSYRAELLTLSALHILALAFKLHYNITGSFGHLWCDNERALAKAKLFRRRIPPSSNHGDILRVLRNVKHRLGVVFSYNHVYGHEDKKKLWHRLSLEEKLNCVCDQLAKAAVTIAIAATGPPKDQMLPLESAAIFLRGNKLTGDISEPTRFALATTEVRRFYIEDHKWSLAKFEAVDFSSLDYTLAKKKRGYGWWAAKQHSDFCGTRLQVARWNQTDDNRCPNCDQPEERASHLNVCPSPERTLQFKESVDKLAKWLESGHTHPALAFWIPKYLVARGRCTFTDLRHYCPPGIEMPQMISELAEEQDIIGWRDFLEGKISKKFYAIQRRFLVGAPSLLNGRDWVTRFISELLDISHTQ
jgi:hypothetical protein